MHESKYRQLKFLGEWCKPAEGVKLSGARKRVWTKNGCSSGEAQKWVPKVQGCTYSRISQVKGQRKHFTDKVFLFCAFFSEPLVYQLFRFLFMIKRNIKEEGIPREWNAEKRELCKH